MNSSPAVPFLDLVTSHQELEQELVSVFRAALSTAAFIGGPMVEQFEAEFAAFCQAPHAVGVGSGTDALRFALIAAGVRPGDVVLTVPNTFIATTEAITQAGAIAEFVDIDSRTYNLDPAALAEYLESRCTLEAATGRRVSRRSGRPVTAVVPVHLYGQMADMDALLRVAGRYNLLVIEDACQAHGAEYFSQELRRWCRAGSMGRAAAFSFYPGKNLGACGEAGAVTTPDGEIARRVRQLRDHGQARKYYHDIEGYNGRLDAIQAGFLSVKLKHLSGWNDRRRVAAATYNQLFRQADAPVVTPYEPTGSKAVYHLYVVQCEERDRLRDMLGEEGIGTGIHYPIPLHRQAAYASKGYREGDFPVAESVAEKIVSLPISTSLTLEQQKRVVAATARAAAACLCVPAVR